MRQLRLIVATASLLFWLSPLVPAHGGLNRWTTRGPEGGYLRAFAVDPGAPTTLYAGTSGAACSGAIHRRAVHEPICRMGPRGWWLAR
jgi:hypothetical protein